MDCGIWDNHKPVRGSSYTETFLLKLRKRGWYVTSSMRKVGAAVSQMGAGNRGTKGLEAGNQESLPTGIRTVEPTSNPALGLVEFGILLDQRID